MVFYPSQHICVCSWWCVAQFSRYITNHKEDGDHQRLLRQSHLFGQWRFPWIIANINYNADVVHYIFNQIQNNHLHYMIPTNFLTSKLMVMKLRSIIQLEEWCKSESSLLVWCICIMQSHVQPNQWICFCQIKSLGNNWRGWWFR